MFCVLARNQLTSAARQKFRPLLGASGTSKAAGAALGVNRRAKRGERGESPYKLTRTALGEADREAGQKADKTSAGRY